MKRFIFSIFKVMGPIFSLMSTQVEAAGKNITVQNPSYNSVEISKGWEELESELQSKPADSPVCKEAEEEIRYWDNKYCQKKHEYQEKCTVEVLPGRVIEINFGCDRTCAFEKARMEQNKEAYDQALQDLNECRYRDGRSFLNPAKDCKNEELLVDAKREAWVQAYNKYYDCLKACRTSGLEENDDWSCRGLKSTVEDYRDYIYITCQDGTLDGTPAASCPACLELMEKGPSCDRAQ